MRSGRGSGSRSADWAFGAGALLDLLRLRTRVDSYAVSVLERIAHPLLEQDGVPPRDLRTITIGIEPIRVLLFGGGLAAGYGAATRADALDQPLARRVTACTGRGSSVQNRAKRHVSLPDSVASLGAVGTHTYHVAVWSPSFVEATRRLSLRSWTVQLHALIRDLRVERAVPLVLLEMPYPVGNHPVTVLARPWINRINAVIRLVASEHDRVIAVATAPIDARNPGEVTISPGYYRTVADDVAAAISSLLGVGCAATTA